MNKQEKAKFVITELKKYYKNLKPFLNHKNAFELLIAVILSAQCTDARVNMVTPALFKKYPTPDKLANADIEILKELVRSTGFFNNKAKNIKACSEMIVTNFDGKVPDNMSDLIKLPGVARKTANVVLGLWYGKNEGIAVDTHVKRLSRVVGLTNESTPEKIEQDLMKLFPRDDWYFVTLGLIQYGRDFCPARKHDESKCFLGHAEKSL